MEQGGSDACETSLIRADRACQGMFPDPVDQVLFADDDPRLWAAKEFVAGEADEINSRRKRLLHGRFMGKAILCSIEQCA